MIDPFHREVDYLYVAFGFERADGSWHFGVVGGCVDTRFSTWFPDGFT